MLSNLLLSIRLLILQCLSPHNYLFPAHIAWIALWLIQSNSLQVQVVHTASGSQFVPVAYSIWGDSSGSLFTRHIRSHVQTKGWNEHLISLIPRSSSNLDHSQTKMKEKGLSCEWHQAKQRRFQTSLGSVSCSVCPSTERPRLRIRVQNTFFWLVTLPLHPFFCLVLNPGFPFRILSCSFHPNFNPRFGPRVPSVNWHNLYMKWTTLFSVFPWHTTGTCISVQKLDCGQILEQGYSFTVILHPVLSNLRMATVSA